MKNEFQEEITNKELDEITKKIMQLSEKKIDNFWFKCGYIYSDKDYKALSKEHIKKIKNNFASAKQIVLALLLETKKQEVIKNLNKISQE